MKTNRSVVPPKKNRGGRPRKFKEASHAITITLPDRVLKIVDAIGPDRARALARAVDHLNSTTLNDEPLVKVLEVAKGVGIIVVAPSVELRRIRRLRLIEVAPARYILTMLDGLSPSDLEITLADLLSDEPPQDDRERLLLTQLHQHLRHLRQSALISRAEILFVSL